MTKKKYRQIYSGCMENPADMSIDLSYPWIVLDTETTGLNVGVDRVIEVGMVYGVGTQIRGEYEQRFQPHRLVGGSEEIHGISDEELVGCPSLPEGWLAGADTKTALVWESDALVWCYNVAFDARMVLSELKSMSPARHRWRELSLLLPLCGLPHEYESGRRYRPSLKKACQALGIENKKAHSAIEDARASAQILIKAVEALDV